MLNVESSLRLLFFIKITIIVKVIDMSNSFGYKQKIYV